GWIQKTAVEAADRVISASRRMRDDILEHFEVDPARVVVIHNGIDPDRFRRTQAREALARRGVREPYVLFVGRITDQKGIFHLLDAAPKLPQGVQVVLCASAPDTPEIEARLKRALPEHPNVVWIGEMVPVTEVVQLYSHAAVFVCPSVYEPFGLINLEAMACETPVVASAVGGILEVVEDGKTGVLVEPAKPEALAAAIRRLLDELACHRRRPARPAAAPRRRRRPARADAARDHRRGDPRAIRALAGSLHRRARDGRRHRAGRPRAGGREGLSRGDRRGRRQRLRSELRASHRRGAGRRARGAARDPEHGSASADRGRRLSTWLRLDRAI